MKESQNKITAAKYEMRESRQILTMKTGGVGRKNKIKIRRACTYVHMRTIMRGENENNNRTRKNFNKNIFE